MKLGLTGGIGSGKSFVAGVLFDTYGVPLLSADESARSVCAKGQEGYLKVLDSFGTDILDAEGELDRSKLAGLVFEDPSKLLDLELIVHPLVKKHLLEQVSSLEEDTVVLEIPLLYEARFEDLVDVVLLVACTEDQQISRCGARDGLDEEGVRKRMMRQMPLRDKVAKADFVVDNNGSFEETRRIVEDLWPKIKQKG